MELLITPSVSIPAGRYAVAFIIKEVNSTMRNVRQVPIDIFIEADAVEKIEEEV